MVLNMHYKYTGFDTNVTLSLLLLNANKLHKCLQFSQQSLHFYNFKTHGQTVSFVANGLLTIAPRVVTSSSIGTGGTGM